MLPRCVKSLRNENSFDRWMKTQRYMGHITRVMECKPTISMNNLSYRKYPISKRYEPNNHCMQIDHENKCLLKKLTSIIMKNKEIIDRDWRRPRSLNGTQRKKELIRITEENRVLLRRLQTKESFYPLKKLKIAQRKRVRAQTPRVFVNLNKTVINTFRRKYNKRTNKSSKKH